LRFEPHIVHFSGHGSPHEEIILEDNDGKSRPVSKEALIGLFKALKDNVRVVVLNSCYSQPQAEALCEVIDFTVGTGQAVKDKSAVAFAAAFYSALSFGRSVQTAFELAKAEINLKGLAGADIPVLLVRQGVAATGPFTTQHPQPVENQPPNPAKHSNELMKAFGSLTGGTADDEDRRLFRRAMFEGKVILIPVEGEPDLATSVTRHGDCLSIKLSSKQNQLLQAELLPQPDGLAPPLPGSIFLGREEDLQKVKQLLGVNNTTRTTNTPTIVRGWPGVGKTTFVSVICRDPDIAQAFPDGVLWTFLDQKPDLFSKLAAWERALTGADSLMSVATLNDAAAKLATLLRNRRMLLVIDDVWDAAHAAPFLQACGNSQSSVLLTTRLPNVANDFSHYRQYPLPVLTEESSILLLRHLIPDIVEQHQELCRALAYDLEYLPLSLHVAGRLLRREAEQGFNVIDSIGEIRAKLLEELEPLNTPTAIPGMRQSLHALLKRSTDHLDEHARDCFAFLGVFAPKPATFDLAAMQAVWEVPDGKPIVRKLTGLGLLEPVSNGRFQMHALLVEHARSLLA